MYSILSNKWRPKVLEDFVGQSEAIYIIKNILKNKYVPHSFIISGYYGTGKTSLARVLVKCLNCETGITYKPCDKCYCCKSIDNFTNPDSIEIDAASKTRLENMKDIIATTEYKSFKNRFRTYIFDECHMLSLSSFNFLLKTLEEDEKNNIYILVTTNIHKIPDTVRSRCLHLQLKKLSLQDIKNRFLYILKAEKIKIDNSSIDKLMFFAQGGLRNLINLLEKFGNEKVISINQVDSIISIPNDYILLNILRFLTEKNFKCMFINIKYITNNTFEIERLLMYFHFIIYKIILYKFKIKYDLNNSILFKYVSRIISLKKLKIINHYLLKYKQFIKFAPNEFIGFEILFMHLSLSLYKIN